MIQHLVALRYVDNYGDPREVYPADPNGSSLGITGLSNRDQYTWQPAQRGKSIASAWFHSC